MREQNREGDAQPWSFPDDQVREEQDNHGPEWWAADEDDESEEAADGI